MKDGLFSIFKLKVYSVLNFKTYLSPPKKKTLAEELACFLLEGEQLYPLNKPQKSHHVCFLLPILLDQRSFKASWRILKSFK